MVEKVRFNMNTDFHDAMRKVASDINKIQSDLNQNVRDIDWLIVASGQVKKEDYDGPKDKV